MSLRIQFLDLQPSSCHRQ